MNKVRMKVSRADVADEVVVADGVERLTDVDGDGGGTHGWLLLVVVIVVLRFGRDR